MTALDLHPTSEPPVEGRATVEGEPQDRAAIEIDPVLWCLLWDASGAGACGVTVEQRLVALAERPWRTDLVDQAVYWAREAAHSGRRALAAIYEARQLSAGLEPFGAGGAGASSPDAPDATADRVHDAIPNAAGVVPPDAPAAPATNAPRGAERAPHEPDTKPSTAGTHGPSTCAALEGDPPAHESERCQAGDTAPRAGASNPSRSLQGEPLNAAVSPGAEHAGSGGPSAAEARQ